MKMTTQIQLPSPQTVSLTPPASTARGAAYRHNPYAQLQRADGASTPSTTSPALKAVVPAAQHPHGSHSVTPPHFSLEQRRKSIGSAAGGLAVALGGFSTSTAEYPSAGISVHTSPTGTPSMRGLAFGQHSFPPSPPCTTFVPPTFASSPVDAPLSLETTIAHVQPRSEPRSGSAESQQPGSFAFSLGSAVTPLPLPSTEVPTSPSDTAPVQKQTKSTKQPMKKSNKAAAIAAVGAPVVVRVGVTADAPLPPPPAYGLAAPQAQHQLPAAARYGFLRAPPLPGAAADAIPYVVVDSVREATIRGEARKSGTRIGEAAAAWDSIHHGSADPSMGRMIDVFVAQLPFDLPLSALQDVADAVLFPPVRIIRAAPHLRKGRAYDGCAFFRMPEHDAARFVSAMHKRVLFDVDGVWVAQTEEQQGRLVSYCRWMQEKRPEERRVVLPRPTPFSAMTAEYALRDMLSELPRAHHQLQQTHAPAVATHVRQPSYPTPAPTPASMMQQHHPYHHSYPQHYSPQYYSAPQPQHRQYTAYPPCPVVGGWM